ncbi:hypothetical protein BDV09DRAFT_7057 [Aspergillus tetrazonus]
MYRTWESQVSQLDIFGRPRWILAPITQYSLAIPAEPIVSGHDLSPVSHLLCRPQPKTTCVSRTVPYPMYLLCSHRSVCVTLLFLYCSVLKFYRCASSLKQPVHRVNGRVTIEFVHELRAFAGTAT